MARQSVKIGSVIAAVAFVALCVGIVAATVVAVWGRSRARHPQSSGANAVGEVVALGHAEPISGGARRSGLGRYRHRVVLLDGRSGEYVADRLFSRGTCLRVRAREVDGQLVVFHLAVHDEDCGRDDPAAVRR